MSLTDRIKEHAAETGFDLIGVAPARESPRAGAFRDWLERGHHADMHWISRRTERRTDPRTVLPGARSILTLGLSYFTEDPPPEYWDDPTRGRIARYAWGPDYHDILPPLLKDLCAFIQREAPGAETETRYYVDTGPVLEREVAWQAGLGFIGKNTLLLHPDWGSTLFLAEILTTADLQPDPPAEHGGAGLAPDRSDRTVPGGCGSCTRCLNACPTHAFPAAYILDSRLCISYLTIEHRGEIAPELRPKMGSWIFGCDECQEVCPWVRQFARPGRRRFLSFDPDRFTPRLADVLAWDADTFRTVYRGTPVRRPKWHGFLRNAAIAAGNSGDPGLRPALETAARRSHPLIRPHAEWALARLP